VAPTICPSRRPLAAAGAAPEATAVEDAAGALAPPMRAAPLDPSVVV
jgi:hypothetical protein